MYDKKHKGKIEAGDLITVMRSLGTSPTFSEIDRHLQVHKIGKVLNFTQAITINVCALYMTEPNGSKSKHRHLGNDPFTTLYLLFLNKCFTVNT